MSDVSVNVSNVSVRMSCECVQSVSVSEGMSLSVSGGVRVSVSACRRARV